MKGARAPSITDGFEAHAAPGLPAWTFLHRASLGHVQVALSERPQMENATPRQAELSKLPKLSRSVFSLGGKQWLKTFDCEVRLMFTILSVMTLTPENGIPFVGYKNYRGCLWPCHPERAPICLTSEAKQGRAWLALGWETA